MSVAAASPTTDAGGSSLDNEVARFSQALRDLQLSEASEVNLVHCSSRTVELELVQRLSARARKLGFVTARISLRNNSFEALDHVVKRLIQGLLRPGVQGRTRPGLVALLEHYGGAHGKGSARRLTQDAAQFGAEGDLTALCLQFLNGEAQGVKAVREFNAWLNGTELGRADEHSQAKSSLSPKTAKRALSEVTRLVRALGYAGCAFFLSEGDRLAKRTPRQREKAYTVLRELVDNLDSGRGAISARFVVSGGSGLFEGPDSIQSLEPLLGRLQVPSIEEPAPPHRSCTHLKAVDVVHRRGAPVDIPDTKQRAARALVRSSQGLPPTEAITSMSVGYKQIDKTIQQLLEFSAISASVFTVLTGDYGTGKTHLLMHLTERALEERRPVFRLSLERLNIDLGNPQRHLSRLLEQSVLPLRHRPSAQDRALFWTASPSKVKALLRVFEELVQEGGDRGFAAGKALRVSEQATNTGRALANFLCGQDLSTKPGTPAYRHDAYARFLLWLELLKRFEDCMGPVVLIDEAENLYTAGVTLSERRTALRSLSFYCGGALPDACVVLAITPKVLGHLKRESLELLEDIAEQRTVLPAEDAAMLRRRLVRVKPQPVPEFRRGDRVMLAAKVRETHQAVRGRVEDPGWPAAVRALARDEVPPRVLVRTLMDRLEHLWWQGQLVLASE